MGNPLPRSLRRRLLQHPINLFQTQPPRLRHAEIRKQQTKAADTAPHEKHFRPQIALILIDDVGRDDRDDAVPEPVARRRERHALGADGEREEFPDHGPRGGAPGGCEGEDVDADKGDEDFGGGVGVGSGGADDGDGEFAEEHEDGAVDEEGASAEALNGVEGERGGADVDDVDDDGDEEGVADAGLLEEGGSIVECID